jgi:hypothetical protein
MRKLQFIGVFLLILGCSPNISRYFKDNRYIKTYHVHVMNDSLQLYFKSPADIEYITDEEHLKRVVRKNRFKSREPILIYGKTDDPPYEYYVTFPADTKQLYPNNFLVYDTIVNGNTLHFIGRSLHPDSENSLRTDLKNIMRTLEIGPSYQKVISTETE